MKPGRELDLLIAIKVMKLPLEAPDDLGNHKAHRYSTDHSAAWEVLDKLHATPRLIYEFGDQHRVEIKMNNKGDSIVAEGESVPHAICLAALEAIENDRS